MTRYLILSASLWALFACGSEATTAPGASTTSPGAAPQYKIVINRPLAAGARFRVQVEARQQIEGAVSSTTSDVSTVDDIDRNVQLSLAGIVTVREVDQDGRASSALLDVESFTASPNNVALVPAGTRIDFLRGEGDYTVMVNGSPRPDLLKRLRLAFPLTRPGSPLGDALFGTSQPKQVGETWSFSKSVVAKSMLEDGYKVRETDLTGDTRLSGTSSVGGVECIELAAKMHAEGATVAENWGVQSTRAGSLDATIKMVLPTNPALPLAMEEATSRGEFKAQAQDDSSSAHAALTLTRYRKALYTQLPATVQ
jgi:hypothetical protein